METITLVLASQTGDAPLIDIDGTAFVQFGIFVVLLLFLTKFVFRPYLALLRERREHIDGGKEQAAKASAEASSALTAYEERIATARKEAAVVRIEKRSEGETRAQEILAEAREKSEAKVDAARAKLQSSAEAAKLALRTRADQIAQTVASKLLGREV